MNEREDKNNPSNNDDCKNPFFEYKYLLIIFFK